MPYALTNQNIRIRYLLERRREPKFSLSRMAELFGVRKGAAYSWTAMGSKHARLPTGVRAECVLAWINDGIIEEYYAKRNHPIRPD